MTRNRRHAFVYATLVAFACGGVGAGCAADPEPRGDPAPGEPPPLRKIEIIATDGHYNPTRVHVEPGQPLLLALRNEGALPHRLALDLGGDLVETAAAAPRETVEIRIEAPREPGEIGFHCSVHDHRARGEEGSIAVAWAPDIGLIEIASGFAAPVAMAIPPDGSGRRFIADQTGIIWIVPPEGGRLAEPFLDLRDRLVELRPGFDDRGLLGLTFHPRYADNGRFFVFYSAPLRPGAPAGWDSTVRLSELRVLAGDPDRADPGSEVVLLEVDKPEVWHDGGALAFGPDGHLYVSIGDGGGVGDVGPGHTPGLGNAQDITNLYGNVLRLDVSAPGAYRVPPDNPFAMTGEGRGEIWAYGFRSPYRFSFDMGGDRALLLGDVGQNRWEEISRVERGGNHGWNILEGTHCYNVEDPGAPLATCPGQGARREPLRWPVIELPNARQEGGVGNAIIGGHVYRGAALPWLRGAYVFGFYKGPEELRWAQLWMAPVGDPGGDLWPVRRLAAPGERGSLGRYLLALGQDEEGELYALTTDRPEPNGTTGKLFQLVPRD